MFELHKIEEAVASIIEAIGEDPQREGLRETPRRVAQMYQELFAGLEQDPAEVLAVTFEVLDVASEEAYREMVILRDVPFYSICEHHFLPFFGYAHIGYVPDGRVVGASKLARVLDILAHRPQLQERLTEQTADVIYNALHSVGVAVVIEAEHLCLSLRGVQKPGTTVVTSATRGSFSTESTNRAELLALLQGR